MRADLSLVSERKTAPVIVPLGRQCAIRARCAMQGESWFFSTGSIRQRRLLAGWPPPPPPPQVIVATLCFSSITRFRHPPCPSFSLFLSFSFSLSFSRGLPDSHE